MNLNRFLESIVEAADKLKSMEIDFDEIDSRSIKDIDSILWEILEDQEYIRAHKLGEK